jgi:hypothetical protein
VGSGKLLLVFANTLILGSESHGTHDHTLSRLYESTFIPSRITDITSFHYILSILIRHGPHREHRVQQFFSVFVVAGTCLVGHTDPKTAR